MNLDKLLKPKKVCIIGANEKTGFGGDTSRNIIKYMREGTYFFVNPNRTEVFGKPCYPSISEVPEDIELVIVCTPQKTVSKILRDAAQKGVGGAVIYASGYKEVGTEEGLHNQNELLTAARETDIAVMGPNCAGFVNYIDNVYPFAFLSEDRDRKGAVGMVSQSGQLCLSLMDNPNMKFSYVISSGNCAVVEMEDYINFLVDDKDTKVVSVYMEGVTNPAKLVHAFTKAAKLRKPIVILKAGRSEKGQSLAASHTGSLAGSDKVFDALLKKFGVIRVNDLEELLYTSQMFAVMKKLPHNDKFASMNLSGGETGICADVGSLEHIQYPDFAPETLAKLRQLLPGYSSPSNPLDTTTTLSYDTEKYAEALRTVMYDESIGLVIVGYTLLQEIADPAIEYMAPAMENVMQEACAKPVAMLPFVGNTRNPEYSARLQAAGVVLLPPPVYAFKILRYLADFVNYDYTKHNLDVALPDAPYGDGRIAHSELKSHIIASKYGVTCAKSALAESEAQAVGIADDFGWPLVMKIESAEILHKSDIGGVKLGINSGQELIEAYHTILGNAKLHCPDAKVNGVLVQQMVPKGAEIIIGVKSDPSFGPSILAGFGGVYVEVFKDTALSLVPVSKFEAQEMIESLKSSKLLKGYRGNSPLDIEALVEMILAVSDMAAANKNEILEIDFNPVFVYEKGVCAADAVVIATKQLSNTL